MLSAVPLGGYVKLTGEDPDEECDDKEHSFADSSVWSRLAIVSAGPIFNMLFAVLIFTVVYMVGIPARSSVIENIIEGSPAMKAGLSVGDKIVSIDNKDVNLWNDVISAVHKSSAKELSIVVKRDNEELTFNVATETRKSKNL